MKSIKSSLSEHKHLCYLLVVVLAVRMFIAVVPPLSGDEATFWEWTRHLAAGYYAHPPMTAWVVWITTKAFGLSVFSIRLVAGLTHVGTMVFVYLIAYEFFRNKSYAYLATLLFALLPISFVLGSMTTTDAMLLVCFTAATYYFKKAIVDEQPNYWYFVAIACGGMLLTKFMAGLFFPGIFFFLLVHKRYRHVFLTKEPYIAALIASVMFSPFLYWNYKNDWLTFQFNFFVRHQNEGFNPLKPLIFVFGQAVAASPVVFGMIIMAMISLGISIYRKKMNRITDQKEQDTILLLSYIIFFPLLYFGFTSTGVEIAPHWLATIYPLGVILVFAIFKEWFGELTDNMLWRSKYVWANMVPAALISLVMAVLVLFPKILPDRMLYIEKVNGTGSLVSHFYGWEEIGEHIDKLIPEWKDRPEGFFLTAEDYSLASMLAFYTPSHPSFYLMNSMKKMIHGKTYLLWEKGKKKIGANTLYIADRFDAWDDRIPGFFKDLKHLDPLIIRDEQGRILRVFYITVGLHYLGGEPDNLSIW